MLAGILNKLGKIGVIVGFLLGTVILTFVVNGNTATIIHLREILIASIGLILVPKSLDIKITDLVGKTKLLPISRERMLEENQDTIGKLNSVSETISEISKSFKEAATTTVENDTQKDNFINLCLDSMEECQNNILYEDITDIDNGILEEIYDIYKNKQEIYAQDIIDIFQKHNSYIVGLEDDIMQVVKLINTCGKRSYYLEKKLQDNSQNISMGLEGVSKVISNIANGINNKNANEFSKEKEKIETLLLQKGISVYDMTLVKQKNGKVKTNIYVKRQEDIASDTMQIQKIEEILSKVFNEKIILNIQKDEMLEFVSEDKLKITVATANMPQKGSSTSGDCSLRLKMDDGKILLALSDGMGSGKEANKASASVIKMIKKMMNAGFEKEAATELINNTISMKSQNETFATLDISIFDLYTGTLEVLKNYACPTYIKRGKEVKTIHAISLPTGILSNIDSIVFDTNIQSGDIVVMCTDGIIEANKEALNKEESFKCFLEEMKTDNVKKMADIILQEAIDQDYGTPKDDMSVIVAKIS